MNNLGQKITLTRKIKGLSQESLSDLAQINLRTLQRIEKGDTYPHGDTILRISKALGVSIEDLIESDLEENIGYIKVMHLSALIFILIPVGNIILPLIFWLLKRNQITDLSFYGKKLLNFQITWSLFAYLPFLFYFVGFITNAEIGLLENLNFHISSIIYIDYLIWYPLNVIYILIASLLIKAETRNFFPIAFKFIR